MWSANDSSAISIHTPTRGVTRVVVVVVVFVDISIHTPTRGVTNKNGVKTGFTVISIHTPTRGVTAIFHKNIFKFL